MTRFEMLKRFANDERTNYKHALLFHVFTESWIDAGKPEQLQVDNNALIELSGLARNTYYKLLKELEEFQYINYKPATSRYAKSVISFQSISIESVQVSKSISTKSVLVRPMKPVTNISFVPIKPCISTKTILVNQSIGTKLIRVKPVISTKLIRVDSSYQYKNDTGNPDSSPETAILAKTGLGANTLLPHNNNHLIKDYIIS